MHIATSTTDVIANGIITICKKLAVGERTSDIYFLKPPDPTDCKFNACNVCVPFKNEIKLN